TSASRCRGLKYMSRSSALRCDASSEERSTNGVIVSSPFGITATKVCVRGRDGPRGARSKSVEQAGCQPDCRCAKSQLIAAQIVAGINSASYTPTSINAYQGLTPSGVRCRG